MTANERRTHIRVTRAVVGGLLAATLVGALLGVIAILGVYGLLFRLRQRTAEKKLNKRALEHEEPRAEEESG